jgi:hypothetical protein
MAMKNKHKIQQAMIRIADNGEKPWRRREGWAENEPAPLRNLS